MNARRTTGTILLALAVTGCLDGEAPFGPFPDRVGSLDTRRIVAIGDGLLAGEQDGALFEQAQAASIPALLARHVGVADFAQPLVSDPGISTTGPPAGRLTLESVRPRTITRLPTTGTPIDPNRATPYHNLAVPGARLDEALTADSDATSISGNRLYDIVLRGRGPVLDQVDALDPTLVLVSFGTSGLLAFARVGADPTFAPGLPTSSTTFERIFETLVESLRADTDQIVLFTVPDVTRFAAFDAVRPFAIDPETGEPFTITIFETVIDPVTGDTLSVQREVPVPLIGDNGPLRDGDLVTLEAEPLIALGVGVPLDRGGLGTPLPDRAVLDVAEQTLIRQFVATYNTTIRALAAEHDLAVVDVDAWLAEIDDGGVVSDGVLLTSEFVAGQAFSLDGQSLTAKARGALVNRLIATLNARFGGRLPPVRTADLPGVSVLR